MASLKKAVGIKVVHPGSSPDVDSDFNTTIRDEVYAHVQELYGYDKVANIATQMRFGSKSAFKAMCTIYGISPAAANKVTALIPTPIEGVECKIKDAFDPDSSRYSEAAEFRAATEDDQWKQIIEGAKAIEGRVSGTGVHACFAAGTLITTSTGLKPIEDVSLGDMVLTHSNQYREVVDLLKRESDDIYSLRTANSIPTKVTGNHPLYVRTIQRVNAPVGENRRPLSEPHWKNVSELVPGEDVIGVPVNDRSEISEDFAESLPVNDPSFWWIAGRFVGDGWCEDFTSRRTRRRADGTPYEYTGKARRTIISVGHDDPTKQEVLDKVGSLFNYWVDNCSTVQKIQISYDEALFEFFKSFGTGAVNKEIPKKILDLPVNLLREFLHGYLSADGSYVNDGYRFNTVSQKLLLGMVSVVNKVYKTHCLTAFEARDQMVIEGRTVECRDRYTASFKIENQPKAQSFFEDGYIWARITECSPINQGSQEVFNFSVLDDNSYVAHNLIAHNCGVIMSSHPLSEVIPTKVRRDDGRVLTQWAYPECESLGLIKMDFLGLDTVDLIQDSVEYIKKSGKTPPNMLDVINGPMDDSATFKMLQRGDTIGIFQLAGTGVQDLLRKMQPDSIHDIAAATALYRPGPMGMLSHVRYAERKSGREEIGVPVHEDFVGSPLDDILGKTYNVVIFQEQVIQIANRIAGMTLQEGDDLRKAMGKKKVAVMAQMKPVFMSGARGNGYSDEAADRLWDTIAEFAKYGFNRAHSYSYAIVAYQAAYLKANYPVEFMAALLATNVGRKEKILAFLKESRKMGLEVGTADINRSDVRVAPNLLSDGPDIVYGLSSIDSVSESVAEEIVKERDKNDPFDSLTNVVDRCTEIGVARKNIFVNLAYSGAFDSFGITRKGAVESISNLLTDSKTKNQRGASLFDMFGGEDEHIGAEITDEEYPFPERIEKEASVIGLYLTAHPLEHVGSEINRIAQTRIKKLLNSKERVRNVKIAGAITDMESKIMPRGKSVMVTIDDGTGYLEGRLSPDLVKALDKTQSQASVKKLYTNGATKVSDYAAKAIRNPVSPIQPLHKNRVYTFTVDFMPGVDDGAPRIRVTSARPVLLADDGTLPIRMRFDLNNGTRSLKLSKVLAKKASEKWPGKFSIFTSVFNSSDPNEIDSDQVYLDALKVIQDSEDTGTKKKKAGREWPPPRMGREKDYEVNLPLEDLVDAVEYSDTGLRADKTKAMELTIEKYLGAENYDLGALDPSIFE